MRVGEDVRVVFAAGLEGVDLGCLFRSIVDSIERELIGAEHLDAVVVINVVAD